MYLWPRIHRLRILPSSTCTTMYFLYVPPSVDRPEKPCPSKAPHLTSQCPWNVPCPHGRHLSLILHLPRDQEKKRAQRGKGGENKKKKFQTIATSKLAQRHCPAWRGCSPWPPSPGPRGGQPCGTYKYVPTYSKYLIFSSADGRTVRLKQAFGLFPLFVPPSLSQVTSRLPPFHPPERTSAACLLCLLWAACDYLTKLGNIMV